MLDLNPFVKIAWNSDAIKNQWLNKFNDIRNLSFEAEYQMVKEEFREANVFHMSPSNFDTQIQKITQDKLTFLPIMRNKMYSGFSHKQFPADKLDMNSFVYGIVAKDLETAEKFVSASEKDDHLTIGQLLGYPKCCCEVFQENWVGKKILDPCYEAALRTNNSAKLYDTVSVVGNGLINIMLRYFGVKVIPFFPCSYDCQEALKVAKVWFSLMQKMNNSVAKILSEILNQPLIWSLHKQIIYITTPQIKGIVNGYDWATRKVVIWNQGSRDTKV